MMEINNRKDSQHEINKLNRQHNERIRKMNRELTNFDNQYNQRKKEIREKGEQSLALQRVENKHKLFEELESHNAKLQDQFDQLEKTKTRLTKEAAKLQEHHKEGMKDLHTINRDQYEEAYEATEKSRSRLNDKTVQFTKDLEDRTNSEIVKKNNLSADKVKALDSFNDDRFETAKKLYEHEFKKNKTSFERNLNKQEKDFNFNYKQKGFRQEKTLNDLEANHQKTIQNKQMHYANILKQKDQSFKQKYQNMVKLHEDIMNRTQERFQNEIDNIVKSHSLEKKNIMDRADDEFYQVRTISPTITDKGKSFEIALEVPPHEKETVQISADKREVKVTLTRRFAENINREDGTTGQSRKSELVTQSFKVADIVDPSKISQSYQDGVLKFNLAKL